MFVSVYRIIDRNSQFFLSFTQHQEQMRHVFLFLSWRIRFSQLSLKICHPSGVSCHVRGPNSVSYSTQVPGFSRLTQAWPIETQALGHGGISSPEANTDFQALFHVWIRASLSFVTSDSFPYFTARSALLYKKKRFLQNVFNLIFLGVGAGCSTEHLKCHISE